MVLLHGVLDVYIDRAEHLPTTLKTQVRLPFACHHGGSGTQRQRFELFCACVRVSACVRHIRTQTPQPKSHTPKPKQITSVVKRIVCCGFGPATYGSCDPYVVLEVQGTRRLRSSVKSGETSPEWEERFEVHVADEAQKLRMVIKVRLLLSAAAAAAAALFLRCGVSCLAATAAPGLA
jgi:hypothetical protein